MTRVLQHSRVELALHEIAAGDGRALLLLHGLGERSPREVPPELAGWPGSVWALDFTGHGASTVPRGGGYTAEILMGDVDAALREIGAATLVGRGLGGYVGLLASGGRPEQVRGLVVRDGPGLVGGGAGYVTPHIARIDSRGPVPPDPYALAELSRDIRPRDYAVSFARQALELSGLARPISVCAVERPEWLAAVVDEIGVESRSLAESLEDYATLD